MVVSMMAISCPLRLLGHRVTESSRVRWRLLLVKVVICLTMALTKLDYIASAVGAKQSSSTAVKMAWMHVEIV